jgi:hypothetical protein
MALHYSHSLYLLFLTHSPHSRLSLSSLTCSAHARTRYGVVDEILSITAMLQTGGALFYRPKDRAVHADNARTAFNHPMGDHLTLLHIWNECVVAPFVCWRRRR